MVAMKAIEKTNSRMIDWGIDWWLRGKVLVVGIKRVQVGMCPRLSVDSLQYFPHCHPQQHCQMQRQALLREQGVMKKKRKAFGP